jgi:hypothetical protein
MQELLVTRDVRFLLEVVDPGITHPANACDRSIHFEDAGHLRDMT